MKTTLCRDVPEDAKIFCILRDPYERALSSYVHVAWLAKNRARMLLSVEKYFETLWHDGTPKYINSHCWPQSYFLEYSPEYLGNSWIGRRLNKVDYFLNINHLNSDLSKITGDTIRLTKQNIGCGLIGPGRILPSEHKTAMAEFKQEKYKEDVKRLYEMDYRLYNEKINNKGSL